MKAALGALALLATACGTVTDDPFRDAEIFDAAVDQRVALVP